MSLQVRRTPMRLETCDEAARNLLIASDGDRRCRRREIFLAEFDGHICEVRLVIRSAMEANVCEPRSIICCTGR